VLGNRQKPAPGQRASQGVGVDPKGVTAELELGSGGIRKRRRLKEDASPKAGQTRAHLGGYWMEPFEQDPLIPSEIRNLLVGWSGVEVAPVHRCRELWNGL
jgi:hypothetical protein